MVFSALCTDVGNSYQYVSCVVWSTKYFLYWNLPLFIQWIWIYFLHILQDPFQSSWLAINKLLFPLIKQIFVVVNKFCSLFVVCTQTRNIVRSSDLYFIYSFQFHNDKIHWKEIQGNTGKNISVSRTQTDQRTDRIFKIRQIFGGFLVICMLDPLYFSGIECVSKIWAICFETCSCYQRSYKNMLLLACIASGQQSHFITSDRCSLWSNNWPHTSHLLHQLL